MHAHGPLYILLVLGRLVSLGLSTSSCSDTTGCTLSAPRDETVLLQNKAVITQSSRSDVYTSHIVTRGKKGPSEPVLQDEAPIMGGGDVDASPEDAAMCVKLVHARALEDCGQDFDSVSLDPEVKPKERVIAGKELHIGIIVRSQSRTSRHAVICDFMLGGGADASLVAKGPPSDARAELSWDGAEGLCESLSPDFVMDAGNTDDPILGGGGEISGGKSMANRGDIDKCLRLVHTEAKKQCGHNFDAIVLDPEVEPEERVVAGQQIRLGIIVKSKRAQSSRHSIECDFAPGSDSTTLQWDDAGDLCESMGGPEEDVTDEEEPAIADEGDIMGGDVSANEEDVAACVKLVHQRARQECGHDFDSVTLDPDVEPEERIVSGEQLHVGIIVKWKTAKTKHTVQCNFSPDREKTGMQWDGGGDLCGSMAKANTEEQEAPNVLHPYLVKARQKTESSSAHPPPEESEAKVQKGGGRISTVVSAPWLLFLLCLMLEGR